MILNKSKFLDEKIYKKPLCSNAKCYIIPKCGFKTKEAVIAVKYGSKDLNFDNIGYTPSGTAHFIEHKLFEEEWGDVFEKFTKSGAYANAFTDFNKTAYYFSCSNNFEENLKTLLEFVQSPYFTDKSVENEKGIIAQEIKMYDDDADWTAYFNLIKTMYKKNNIRENIAGSVSSIENITKEILYNAYKANYVPKNMTVVCSGDFEADRIGGLIDSYIKKSENKLYERLNEKEPEEIESSINVVKMGLGFPIFCCGIKITENDLSLKRIYGMKILLDIIAGEGSELFETMYIQDILNESPALEYIYGDDYCAVLISGSSKSPERFFESFLKEIGIYKKNGINKDNFNRILNKHKGKFIRGFNSIDSVVMGQLEIGINGFDLIEAFDVLQNIDIKYLDELLKLLDEKKSALSIVN